MTLDPTTGTRAHATTWIALVSLLATIVGCGSKQPWESDAPAAGRNLILFTLDTMRADHITCYGGPDGTEGVGVCTGGTQTCLPDASGFGPWRATRSHAAPPKGHKSWVFRSPSG